MTRDLALVAALVAALVPCRATAQSSPARDLYQEGLRLAQAGDTLAAVGSLERALEIDPEFAEAHYQKGMLHFAQASSDAFDFEDRMIAQKAFQQALRLDPGNPRYLVSLGKLLLMQQIRVDARRVFERALLEAERAAPGTMAEVHFQLAVFRETQWLRFKLRHTLPLGISQLRADMAFADPTYVWDMLDRSVYEDGQGRAQEEQMLYHLRQALAADPGHVGAATHLLAYHYDEGQVDRFMSEARDFARAAPSEPRAYLALGLGLHAQGRDDEAAGAFEYAMELMPTEHRRDFEAVSRIMRKDRAEQFEGLEGRARQEAVRRFWVAADPLFLTPSNEFWVEYLSRMAYSDLRFGLPEYRIPGWQTDRGVIWVRYGRPARQAVFAADPYYSGDMEAVGQVTTVWSYGREGPVFVFRQNPGFRKATFANDFRFYAEDYRSMQPASFSAPSLPALISMPAQVARFRGPSGEMDVEVHAAVPLDTLGAAVQVAEATLETGFFVVDPDGAEIRRIVETEEVDFQEAGARWVRSWRASVPEGRPYLVSVETRDPLSWAASHHRSRVDAKRFPPGEPSASDLLLAKDLEATVDQPTRREQIRMRPEPTLTFGPEEPVGVYFELYNFLPDEDQFASYELELVVRVEEIYRTGLFRRMAGEIADLWGFSEEGRQAVQLRFSKENRVVARDMIPEYFTFQMDQPPAGRFGLTLNVLDRNAGREFTIERTFEILPEGMSRP